MSSLAIIAPAAGLLIGGAMIIKSIVDGRTAKASVHWPSVPGTVVFSGMVEDRTGGDASNSSYPQVTYSYFANGQTMQSSRVNFSAVKNRKILTQYPKGATVPVFFDPQRPASAVLEKGGSTIALLLVGVAVIVGTALVGAVLAYGSANAT